MNVHAHRHQQRRETPLLAFSLLLAACTPQSPRDGQTPSSGPEAARAAPAQQAREEAPDAHVDSIDVRGAAFVRETTALRRIGSDARFVEAKGNKKQPNVVTLLQRGEAIEVLEAQAGFLRAKLSDETVGWVRQSAIRVGQNLSTATTLSKLHCFTRPDLLAMDAARSVEPGTLLFVLREKDAFAEVDVGPQATVWVLTDALERSAAEVEAAKIYQRASAIAARDADRAAPLFELLRSRFAPTRLVQQWVPPADAAQPEQPGAETDIKPVPADANGASSGVDLESLSAPLAPPLPAP